MINPISWIVVTILILIGFSWNAKYIARDSGKPYWIAWIMIVGAHLLVTGIVVATICVIELLGGKLYV